MKMKRIIAGLLALSMLLMFTACGKKPTDEETSTIQNERILYPETEDDTETETETEEESSAAVSSNNSSKSESNNVSSNKSSSKVIIKKELSSSPASSKTTASVTSKKTSSKNENNTSKESSNTSSKESSSEASSSSSSGTSSIASSSMGSSSKVDTATDTTADTNTDTQTDTNTDTQTDTDSDPEKILVVYFSRAGEQINGTVEEGNTAIVANIISNYLGADSKEITPLEDKYPVTYNELLDYAKEEKDNSARPEIAEDFSIISEYDTVFVGYPIWWSDMPMIMYTFFESYEFTGKKIVPFCTYGSSGESGTFATIKSLTPDAEQKTGFGVPGEDAQNNRYGVRDSVITWLEGLGYGE